VVSKRAVVLLSLACSACGARTGLLIDEVDAADSALTDTHIDSPDPGCFTKKVITLASGQAPYGLVLDGDYVYWSNDSPDVVRRVRKTGGAVEDVAKIPPSGYTGFGLTLDDTSIYTGETAIYRIPKGGGPATLLVSSDAIHGVTTDAASIFWAEISGHVRFAPKSGGTPIELASPKGGATRLVVDETFVYYTMWYPPNGGVWRVKKSGGAPELLAPGAYSSSLVLDASTLYWNGGSSTSGPGGIWSVPKAGGTVTSLAPAIDPRGMALDETFVYWAADGTSVHKVPKRGGTTTLVAADQQNAHFVAIDDVCAYWSLDVVVGEIRVGPK